MKKFHGGVSTLTVNIMAKLIIVSNRLPVSVKKEKGKLVFDKSVGGLATGLSSYVENKNNTWVGWPGIATEELSEEEKITIISELVNYNCVPIFLNKNQIDNFYNGFSNSILWPLFHNLKVTFKGNYDRWWRAYKNINNLFADVIIDLSTINTTIWIQDYQLALIPSILQKSNGYNHIGFFLHIPFPDVKVFSKLPNAQAILKGMLGASLIGFHTDSYVKNFMDACSLLANTTIYENQITYQNRIINVSAFPMGIDYEKFAVAGRNKVVKTAVKKYKRRYKKHKLIVSLDRLDPSKGLIERLNAYDELLQKRPDLNQKVILSMVVAPS